jgi:hypothetical protein
LPQKYTLRFAVFVRRDQELVAERAQRIGGVLGVGPVGGGFEGCGHRAISSS